MKPVNPQSVSLPNGMQLDTLVGSFGVSLTCDPAWTEPGCRSVMAAVARTASPIRAVRWRMRASPEVER
jgi:hypothetical protein